MSLSALANATELSKPTLSLHERGHRALSPEALARVEAVLCDLERRARLDAARCEAGTATLERIAASINYGRM